MNNRVRILDNFSAAYVAHCPQNFAKGSLCAAVTICTTLVIIKTHTDRILTSLYELITIIHLSSDTRNDDVVAVVTGSCMM